MPGAHAWSPRFLSRPARRRCAAVVLLTLFAASLPGVWCQIRCVTVDGHHAGMVGSMAPCHGRQTVLSVPHSAVIAPVLPATVVTLVVPLHVIRPAGPEAPSLLTGLPRTADPPPPRSL